MVFQSIGFHTALILNKLQIERSKSDIAEDKNDADEAQKRDEEATRAKLAMVKRRLADLAAFEDRSSGKIPNKRRGGS